MIEITILNHLKQKLTVSVYLEKPEPAPPEYILFEKTGSDRNNHLSSSTFAFQSYSESMYGASTLNEEVKQAVDSLIELDNIASVSLNTDYNFTDTTTKKYRYQAVYDIKHY
ncbi:MAG TPA: hypothetical protein VFC73_08845 [Syntrophomonadaceae bacterium]|nr:hypothetical protein [Syntrophomonadaceae bacterium]